jgi:opacity protein-like surface antigen
MTCAAHTLADSVRCNFHAQRSTVAVRRRTACVVAAVVAALTSIATDAAEESRFQVTPFAGYATGGEFETEAGVERDADDTGGWGLALSLEEQAPNYYEFLFASFDTEVEGDTPIDMDIDYLQIGGTAAWPDGKWVIPYLGLTVGAARFSPDVSGTDSATKFAFSIGAGVRVPITEHIGIRGEWRSYGTVLGGDSDLFCASANGAATCALRSHSDVFMQHTAQLGVMIGF